MLANKLDSNCKAQQMDLGQIQILRCNKDGIHLREVNACAHGGHMGWDDLGVTRSLVEFTSIASSLEF